jgi:tetratricopeptide (TPR) repeat protein
MTCRPGNRKVQGRHYCGALFASFLLAALGTTPHATAATPLPNAQQLALYEHAAEEDRVRLLITFAKSGKHELAAFLLQRYPLQGPHAVNRTLFLEGLFLKANRNYTGAVRKFRAALASDPKLTLVRAELAETLVTLDEDESAIHHLRLLEGDAPNAEAAAGVRAFIDQVDERSPFKYNTYLSLAPTTNVNNGSRHKKIYLPGFEGIDIEVNEDSRQKSGVGLAAGFNAAYSRRMGNDFSFVAGGSGEARIYDDFDFNSYALSQSLEMRYLMSRGHLGLGAVASQNLETDELGLSYFSFGPRASIRFALTPKDTLTLSGVYEWREYTNSDASDGEALLLDANITHAIDSSFNVTLSGGYDDIGATLGWNAYVTWTVGLGFYKELPMGITAQVSGEARLSDFDDVNLFVGTVRKDERYSANLTLTKRDLEIHGFAPSLSYTYTLNQSNIALYDFDSHAVEARLTKSF